MFNFSNQNVNNYNNENIKNSNNNQMNHSNFEVLQRARKDLIGEIAAIMEYDEHIHNSNVPIANATWENIRNEELVHMGELLALIIHLAPYQKDLIESGVKEFEERLQNIRR